MQVTSTGSVRVDLVGGTLDLEPINLILKDVVTLNVATSLKAEVQIEEHGDLEIIITSEDYDKTYVYPLSDLTPKNLYYSNFFKEMSFVLQIIATFINIKKSKGLKVSLKSGAPAGSGLGGSSAMGVTLYRGLCEFFGKEASVSETVSQVKGIEGRILNKGMPGYQDYYPALLGGVLCLKGMPGEIIHEQLYTDELKQFLEKHLTLVYSGISRNSGINNWDVYKGFFDGDVKIRETMSEIAKVSYEAYKNILKNDFENLLRAIGREGELRKKLAPGIVPAEVEKIYHELEVSGLVNGMKMCGAGGGGCFILLHKPESRLALHEKIEASSMRILNFSIDRPH